ASADSVLVTPPLTFSVTVPVGAPSQIVNEALMFASGGGVESTPATTNTGSPLLAITKSNSPTQNTVLLPGDPITYTMFVENIGAGTATNVTVTDAVPANTSYVSCSGGASCSLSSGIVTWNIGTLASGQNATVTMVVSAITTASISNSPIP